MAANLINSLLSLGYSLLPSIKASALSAPSSSSSNNNSGKEICATIEHLESLMSSLEGIKVTLYDAEQRESGDHSVKLWLKEVKTTGYDADDVLSEYQYEATRVRVEETKASKGSGLRKRKQMEYIVPIPDGMADKLKKIVSRFDELEKHRVALQLREIDGARRRNNQMSRPSMGHRFEDRTIFGRDADVTEVINLLLSGNEKPLSVISIVGKGGLGKTTIAQLVYKDARARQCFDLFGWVCVADNFNVGRMFKATLESFTRTKIGSSELSSLQEELLEIVKDKKVLLVLDDVWNKDRHLWESFRFPLSKAKSVHILVTTRNEKVAEVMLTTSIVKPDCLPEDSCWQLFQHYAFHCQNNPVSTHFVNLGREIMRKCGGIPLAVKSIACLLRHETDEKSWKEILENNLWESKASNNIFPALHFSYAHLPAHLKPCFLVCSMYPKNYLMEAKDLIEIWISHGYIESQDKRRMREVGVEYYDELKGRSFFDDLSDDWEETCKLHDLIHDLARLNCENEHYSVDISRPLDNFEANILPEAYHLYAIGFTGFVNQIPEQKLQCLRTFSMDLRDHEGYCGGDPEHEYCIRSTDQDMDCTDQDMDLELQQMPSICMGTMLNLTHFNALRVLELKGEYLVAIHDSISELKHLSHLHINSQSLAMLPESIGLLYNLQIFILECINSPLEYLPESIGYLINLRCLCIKCDELKKLPESLGSLTNLLELVIECEDLEKVPSDIRELRNLRELAIISELDAAFLDSLCCLTGLEELSIGTTSTLPGALGDFSKLKSFEIRGCSVNYNPGGLKNFPEMRRMAACLRVKSIGWLKDMKDLEGELIIEGLENTSDIVDAQHANLSSKCNIETLHLHWHINHEHEPFGQCIEQELRLMLINEDSNDTMIGHDDINVGLLKCLQPHPHLKGLVLGAYPAATVPDWMQDPLSLPAIQEIRLVECSSLQSLPFSKNLNTLKHLRILWCSSFIYLQLEQLPSQLEKLEVIECEQLELITGLWNLRTMLARLEVTGCKGLQSITMDELQSVESTDTLCDLQSTLSLKDLVIENCPLLHSFPHQYLRNQCNVSVHGCGCPDVGHRNPSVYGRTGEAKVNLTIDLERELQDRHL